MAIYLDPFLDGDVPPSQYEERSKGYLLSVVLKLLSLDPAPHPDLLCWRPLV